MNIDTQLVGKLYKGGKITKTSILDEFAGIEITIHNSEKFIISFIEAMVIIKGK